MAEIDKLQQKELHFMTKYRIFEFDSYGIG